MKTRYKMVNTRTEKGLKEAEDLKENGWIIYSVGFYLIYFYKTP